MPSSASTTTQEYADQHHLFVVNQNNANAVRSNHPLGEVVNVTSSYLQGTYGTDVNGHSVYEPRESHKGNAARALLYMSLRYNGIGGQNWTFNHLNSVVLPALNEDPQVVQQLLQWHLADPPDAEEISRNDYVQSIQGNRNPFVDHPSWVDFINFADLSYVFRNANNNPRVNENSQTLNVFPSPFNDKLKVSFASSSEQVIDISLLNVQGVCVYKQSYVLSNGLNEFQIDGVELPNGMYILVGQTSEQVHTARIIKTNRP
jgi:hypothetical protein